MQESNIYLQEDAEFLCSLSLSYWAAPHVFCDDADWPMPAAYTCIAKGIWLSTH